MAVYPTIFTPTNIDSTPSATPTLTSVAVGITAVSLLPANVTRKGFTTYNNSNRTVYLGTANTVTTSANFFAIIPPNSLYEWSLESIYNGAVFAIANGTGANCQILELTP